MEQSLYNLLEQEILPRVEKPVRYLGNELNIRRKDLSGVSLHGVLCFPDTYEIGMSHYGLQVLYHIINGRPAWALSRSFHPWTDAEQIMRARHIPLYSLEYYTPVATADWIGFSLQYELQYTSMLNMLDLAGVPLLAEQRAGSAYPLIVAGGPCVCNPEPIADFVDVVVAGDGEDAVVRLCEIIESGKKEGRSRIQVLEELSANDGFYVPALYPANVNGMFVVPDFRVRQRVKAARIREIEPDTVPLRPLVPLIDVVHHRLAVEIARGCSRGCRFCSAGMHYRPVRERDSDEIHEQIMHSVDVTGWEDIGLLSLSTADYTRLSGLLAAFGGQGHSGFLKVSMPSTRIDALTGRDVDSFYNISHSSSFTIAPEAGSQRLREAINKGFTEQQILDTVALLLKKNINTIKLYFMIGLPGEQEADIEGIIGLTGRLSDMARRASRRCGINVSLSPFSPKPNTPFQWEAMGTVAELVEKGSRIKSALGKYRNVKVSYRDPRISRIETLCARGDRSVGKLVLEAWKNGAKLDGWNEMFDADRWNRAGAACDVDMNRFLGEIPVGQALPWSVVDFGVTDRFLREEREKARQGIETPDCRNGNCSACGACAVVPRRYARQAVSAGSVRGVEPAVVSDAPASSVYYRVMYSKDGNARFLGHRDMSGLFHRAIRAARIPVAFSSGFHPHPRIAFGPPLPLGAAGHAELLDCALTREWQADPPAINRYLPGGLRVLSIRLLPEKPSSLNAQIVAARYRIVPNPEKVSPEWPVERVAGFLRRTEVTVECRKKEMTVDKNIRPLVLELGTVAGEGGAPVLDALLATTPERSCSAADLIRALFPENGPADFYVTRVCCYSGESDGRYLPLE